MVFIGLVGQLHAGRDSLRLLHLLSLQNFAVGMGFDWSIFGRFGDFFPHDLNPLVLGILRREILLLVLRKLRLEDFILRFTGLAAEKAAIAFGPNFLWSSVLPESEDASVSHVSVIEGTEDILFNASFLFVLQKNIDACIKHSHLLALTD